MPVVPYTPRASTPASPPAQPIPTAYLLMAQAQMIADRKAKLYQYDTMSPSERADWERTWKRATPDTPANRSAVPPSNEMMSHPASDGTPGTLFTRPPPAPPPPSDFIS